jgi:uncharacterized protein YecE (DUF72 family)
MHDPLVEKRRAIRVGCAGWNMPRELGDAPADASHLERYASVFPAVEINSSFYRPHRRATYERWAATVPDDFRFSAKVPKSITHEQRLETTDEELTEFLEDVSGLEPKLAWLLVQLPPSLEYDGVRVHAFFKLLRKLTNVGIVCEPRHATWFESECDSLLHEFDVGRVVADPLCDPRGARPGGSTSALYVRLHGSPRMYYSAYDEATLERWSELLRVGRDEGRRTWCIFDNTAARAATGNALRLKQLLDDPHAVGGETLEHTKCEA